MIAEEHLLFTHSRGVILCDRNFRIMFHFFSSVKQVNSYYYIWLGGLKYILSGQ